MFYRIRSRVGQMLFDRRCRPILQSPPIDVREGGPVVASMLCHRDVLMYLVAVKSLLHGIGGARVAVLSAGSLTASDAAVLNQHLPGISITGADSIDMGPCPSKACFERLLFVAELAQHSYVVELDADTVTTGPIPEIVQSIHRGRSFILGTSSKTIGNTIVSMRDAWAAMRSDNFAHPQVAAERNFDKLPDFEDLSYVRGSAALVGFAPGSVSRELVYEWSTALEELVGREQWSVWGAEQTVVNLLVANTPEAMVLPYDRYVCHPDDADYRRYAFMHFYSPYRFTSSIYAEVARDVVLRLTESTSRRSAPPRP